MVYNWMDPHSPSYKTSCSALYHSPASTLTASLTPTWTIERCIPFGQRLTVRRKRSQHSPQSYLKVLSPPHPVKMQSTSVHQIFYYWNCNKELHLQFEQQNHPLFTLYQHNTIPRVLPCPKTLTCRCTFWTQRPLSLFSSTINSFNFQP